MVNICNKTQIKLLQKNPASSGNRTRIARVAGEHSTIEPTMHLCDVLFLWSLELNQLMHYLFQNMVK